MSSGIGITVCIAEIMREMLVLAVVKAELQHLHAGISAFIEHFSYLGRYKAKVLGNNIKLAQFFLAKSEKLIIRSLFPFADSCVNISVGNGIIAFKASEMVDTYCIIKLRSTLYTVNPPSEACFFMICPIVKRISPKLTHRRKFIRRTACNSNRGLFLIKRKSFGEAHASTLSRAQ